jgi:hypothetical protein
MALFVGAIQETKTVSNNNTIMHHMHNSENYNLNRTTAMPED